MEKIIDYDAIISENMGLVNNVLKRFTEITSKYKSIKEDMTQVGMIALYKAIDTFDESKNAKFSTYATVIMERDMLNFVNRSLSKYYDDRYCVSFESKVGNSSDDEELTLEKTLGKEDDTSYLFNNDLLKSIEDKYGEKTLKILMLRSEGNTLEEIAKEIGVTKQRISAIIKKVTKEITI